MQSLEWVLDCSDFLPVLQRPNTAGCVLCPVLVSVSSTLQPRTSSASAHPCLWNGAGVSSGDGRAGPV